MRNNNIKSNHTPISNSWYGVNLSRLALLFLLGILTFSACKKDEIIDKTVIINPPPTVVVNGSVSGLVLDENHQGLMDATVRIGMHSTMTDENGVFIFRDISLEERGALVTAEKNGYFYNAKFIRPILNKLSFTKFKMTEKLLSGSVSSNTGGSVFTNGEAKVTLPVEGIKIEGGGLYNGVVNVYATWIDPTGVDLLLEMPGDLRGQNTEDEQVQLTSFGMIGVELEGAAGEALNLADGQVATIELPVPNTLLATAPATIPLWHFDEATGFWVEEGEAVLQGGKYVGTVGHFSFWNCDVPNDFIELKGSVVNEEGAGIQNLLVQITSSSNGASAYGYTNEDGIFGGFVPNDEELTLTVFDACNTVLYSAQIGPFSADAILNPITINNTTTTFITLSGKLENCDMAGVSNGYLSVEYGSGSSIIPLETDGSFNSTINLCSETTVEVTGFDIDNLKRSETQNFDVTGLTTLSIGTITTCDSIEEYFTLNISTQSAFLNKVEVNFTGNELTITATDSINFFGGNALITVLDATTLNTDYTPVRVSVIIGDFTTDYADCMDPDCSDMTVTFTSLDYTNPGDVLEGSYEGTILNSVSILHEVNGSFSIVKD